MDTVPLTVLPLAGFVIDTVGGEVSLAELETVTATVGVRIPKAVLRQSKLDPSRPVQLRARERAIVIEQAPHPRAGWEESFKKKRPRKPENLWGDLPMGAGWDK